MSRAEAKMPRTAPVGSVNTEALKDTCSIRRVREISVRAYSVTAPAWNVSFTPALARSGSVK